MSEKCRDCYDTGGFEGIPATQCPSCGRWCPDCVTPPSTTATLTFSLDDPEGERRLRECLDAPRWKMAVWECFNWLHNEYKYGKDERELRSDVLEAAYIKMHEYFNEQGIDIIWED